MGVGKLGGDCHDHSQRIIKSNQFFQWLAQCSPKLVYKRLSLSSFLPLNQAHTYLFPYLNLFLTFQNQLHSAGSYWTFTIDIDFGCNVNLSK